MSHKKTDEGYPIFRSYLEEENDKPYYSVNTLSFYYEDMERKQKLIEDLAKAIAGYDQTLTGNLQAIEQQVAERFEQWDEKLKTFDGSVMDLLQEWVDDGTMDHIVDSSIVDRKLEPLTAQLAETATKEELQQVSLSFKESYADLTALQTAYPTGDASNHAVLADGFIYTYTDSWISTGIKANGTGIAEGTVDKTKLTADVRERISNAQQYTSETKTGNPIDLTNAAQDSTIKSLKVSGASPSVMLANKNLLPVPQGSAVASYLVYEQLANGLRFKGADTGGSTFNTSGGQITFAKLPVGTYQFSFDMEVVTSPYSLVMRMVSNNVSTNTNVSATMEKQRYTYTITVGSDKSLLFRVNGNEIIMTNIMLSPSTDSTFEAYDGQVLNAVDGQEYNELPLKQNVIADAGTLEVVYRLDSNLLVESIKSDIESGEVVKPGSITETKLSPELATALNPIDSVYLMDAKSVDFIAGEQGEIFKNGLINFEGYPVDYSLTLNSNMKSYLLKDTNGRYLFDFSNITADTQLTATFNIRDRDYTVLESKAVTLNVVTPPANPATPKNILMVGDSLSKIGDYPQQLKERLTVEKGLTNYNFVGRLSSNGVNMEAYGGYHWGDYTLPPEELEDGHENAFWNAAVNDIDFQYYMNTYCAGVNLDYVIITLGTNNYAKSGIYSDMGFIDTAVKKFLNRLHADYPNCKVLLVSQHKAPSVIFEGDIYYMNRDIWMNDLAEYYETTARSATYSSFVHFVNMQLRFDNNGGAPYEEETIGLHSGITKRRYIDYVHPSTEGFRYYADGVLAGFFAIT